MTNEEMQKLAKEALYKKYGGKRAFRKHMQTIASKPRKGKVIPKIKVANV